MILTVSFQEHRQPKSKLIIDYLATERIPSYFELETEVFPEGGHVCRFDSVSKLLSAGIRLVCQRVSRYESRLTCRDSSLDQQISLTLWMSPLPVS